MSGPGICGLTHPFRVTALADGTVITNAPQTLGCPMIAALDTWIAQVVQPAAQARFGERVVRINSMGSYSCRGINNMAGAHLSEHSFANAIDIGGFVLESGRELNIMRGFNGSDEQVRAFLHEAHAGACGFFTTVLGPGYNIFHYNHFHLDLAMHGATSRGPRRYCKPVPQSNLPEPPRKDDLPDPPAIEEELDIARAAIPHGSGERPSLVAAVPAAPLPRAATPVARSPDLVADRTPSPPSGHRMSPVISFAAQDDAGGVGGPVRFRSGRDRASRRSPPIGSPGEQTDDAAPAPDPGEPDAAESPPPSDLAGAGGRRPPPAAGGDLDLTSSIR